MKTFKETMSELMKEAWNMVRTLNYTMSEAMKAAWKSIKLRNKMVHGVVEFTFTKKDGSIRKALGTLASQFLPAKKEESGKTRKPNYSSQVFFDMECHEFRSYTIANLI